MIVPCHGADVDGCVGPLEVLIGETGSFSRFIDSLKKQPLLRVHGLGLPWVDLEERRIEGADIISQEVGLLDVCTTTLLPISVVEGIWVESFWWDGCLHVSLLAEEIP